MSDKPRVHVEYIEVSRPGAVVGIVIWEYDFHMVLDAKNYMPSLGEEVKPRGKRSLYHVVGIRREYLATGIRFKVILEKKQRGRKRS